MCNRVKGSTCNGFALVVALSLMAFILMLVLGLATMVRVETQTATSAKQMNEAKANALLGLKIGLGQLQRLTGPDTRVTARSEILGIADTSPYRYWTGVWDSEDLDPKAALDDHTKRRAYDLTDRKRGMGWLVSGLEGNRPEDIDPLTINIPTRNQVELVAGNTTENIPAVVAGKQRVSDSQTSSAGTYAWWVGDEGVKARINVRDSLAEGRVTYDDLVGPAFSFGTDTQKLKSLSAAMAQKNGAEHIDDLRAAINKGSNKNALSRIYTTESLDVLLGQAGAVPSHIVGHDITTYSNGLLTDVRKGGFKKDLTLAFNDADVFKQYFGRKPSPATMASNLKTLYEQSYNFTGNGDGFYMAPELERINGQSDVGPNWGSLYHYYHLYELPGVANGSIKPIAPWPYAGHRSPIRIATYPPYQNFRDPNFIWEKDGQHVNSPISPVLERINFIVRVGAVASTDETGKTRYKLRFYMQPLVGLWNPYNIKLEQAYSTYYRYRIDCEAAPEFVISGTYDDGTLFNETVNLARGYGHAGYEQTEGYWSLQLPQDLDFEPGEIRLFSTKTAGSNEILTAGSNLDYGWDESKGFHVDWPYDPTTDTDWTNDADPQYLQDSAVTIHTVTFKDRTEGSGSSNYSGSFFVLKHMTPGGSADTGHFQRVSALWKDAQYNSGSMVAGGVTEGTIAPFDPSTVTGGNYKEIGSWLFHLRTTTESTEGIRNGIDGNLRALAGSASWDGPGMFAMAPLAASGDHGYTEPLSLNEPTFGEYEPRYTGINGASIEDFQDGVSYQAIYEVPRYPLVSVGQFQHANLAQYSFEPGYVVGNSYANLRIPLDEIVSRNFDGQSNVNLFDIPYLVNDTIFDEYFFSTIDPKLSDDDLVALNRGAKSLYNTRNKVVLPPDNTVDDLLNSEDKINAWGGRFMVEGAFNVNSTSVNAWKAVLGSMDQPLLVIDPDGALKDVDPNGVYVSRLSLPLYEDGYMGAAQTQEFFQGVRKITDAQLQSLAEAIVEEVKSRGPFLSMSDFVNRRLGGSREEQQRSALQAALDRTVNQNIAASLTDEPANFTGSEYSDAVKTSGAWTDKQAAGAPGYVLQGDLLQVLAPVLTARSDTFVIRAYGSTESISGETVAEAWCEAVVQRCPDMVATGNDLSDVSVAEMGRSKGELVNDVNQRFGRSYRVLSFRWLSSNDL